MRVVFLEEVTDVAKAGDVKTVKNGYARNYLFPRNLAVLATPNQLRRVETLKRAAAQQQENAQSRAEKLAPELEGLKITIRARSGSSGRLYGSVTSAVIATELSGALGREIAGREVVISEPIKAIGTYQTKIRLSPEIEPTITLEVVEAEEKKAATRRKPRAEVAAPAAEEAKEVEPSAPETAKAAGIAIVGELVEAKAEAAVPEPAASVEEQMTEAVAEAKGEVLEAAETAAEAPPAGDRTPARKPRARAKGAAKSADQTSAGAAVRRAKRRTAKTNPEGASPESASGEEKKADG